MYNFYSVTVIQSNNFLQPYVTNPITIASDKEELKWIYDGCNGSKVCIEELSGCLNEKNCDDISPRDDSIYDGCGDSKVCYGFPTGCIDTRDCNMFSAVCQDENQDFIFDLLSMRKFN